MNQEMLEDEGIDRFPDLALWGKRGAVGIAAYSNHAEGIHVWRNEVVGHLKAPI
jgi:hypothetical protein